MSIVLYAARSSFPIIVVKNHVRIGIPCSLKDTAHKNIYTVHSNSVIRSSRNVCKFLKMANNDDQPYKFIRHPYLSSLCFPLFSFCSPAHLLRICSRGVIVSIQTRRFDLNAVIFVEGPCSYRRIFLGAAHLVCLWHLGEKDEWNVYGIHEHEHIMHSQAVECRTMKHQLILNDGTVSQRLAQKTMGTLKFTTG